MVKYFTDISATIKVNTIISCGIKGTKTSNLIVCNAAILKRLRFIEKLQITYKTLMRKINELFANYRHLIDHPRE